MRPIGVDLFAGAGGLTLGFEQAGFDVVAAVEIDPIHCATHEYNFPNCSVICNDIQNVTGMKIRTAAGIGERDVDVVFGGAPCQGFSMIGQRILDDPRNILVKHFVRIVRELAPKYFVFENVKGLTLGKHKRFLDELIFMLSENYDILLPYRVLNAAEYGIPQDRRRLFLIGARKGLKLPTYPESSKRVTVLEAIGDIPDAERYPELVWRDNVEAKFGKPSPYARELRETGNMPVHFGHRREYDRSLLTSSMRADHSALSRKRFAETAPGRTEPVSRFHKLDPDGVCNTLRAGTNTDRGAFTSPRPIHFQFDRCITVREAARLHSYPDWFRFHITKWHGFRQIGNSVPPMLGRAIASTLITAMQLRPSVPTKILSLGDSQLLCMTLAQAASYYGVPTSVIAKRDRNRGGEQINGRQAA